MSRIGNTIYVPEKKQWTNRTFHPFAWISKALQRSIAIILVIAVWELVPRIGWVDRTFVPPLSEVLQVWWQMILSGEMWEHVQASLFRSLSGFFLAIIYAVPLGLIIGYYRKFAKIINPLIELFRNTAALALLPVFILVLGIGEISKVSIVLYACSWPILLNTISGVKNVDPLLIKSARSMGLSSFRLFQKVILPAAVPTIFTGIRLAGATSILVLIAAEMVGARSGLGYLVNYAQFSFLIPNMYAGIITISMVGILFNQSLVALERKFTAWKVPSGE